MSDIIGGERGATKIRLLTSNFQRNPMVFSEFKIKFYTNSLLD